MEEERFDAVVVGGGPAGAAAAITMAREGLDVVVIERGAFAGSKNVMGGILYHQPTEAIVPGFADSAPLERPIFEQRYVMLTEDSHLGLSYRTQQFAAAPFNSYSVLRADWDQWFAAQAEEAGAFVISGMVVRDLLWRDGKVDGVTTGEDEGDLRADVVVLCDGANSLLAQKAGLHSEWQPDEQALVAKEIIELGEEVIDQRFNLHDGMGVAMEIFGASTAYMLGYGFIYTNKSSISIGTGALLSDLVDSGLNVSDLLTRFKGHPSISPLIEGGEVVEYAAKLIPERGWQAMPTLYGDGVLVAGDAAMFSNPLNREGANLAMISGVLAGETAARARERSDFSAATLSFYRELLEDSVVFRDLHKIRDVTDFAHARPYLLDEIPEVVSQAMREYLTVDGVPKKDKQKRIMRLVQQSVPVGRTIRDLKAARSVLT